MSLVRGGPMLVEGPVEVVLEDGSTERSDRFTVALCTCRRSRRFPWCDTSHRRRVRGTADEHGDSPGGGSGSPREGSPREGGSSSTG
ncbi:CDGSH iron-sulfur domain-containing protein [Streptomyces xinghaiensis]|uniref:CDGSH iron-sulfur domain-containing protein n=1 Tax=Streptomyces xinghaiensis TaxID=1038928 RepID=UPI003F4CEF3B